MTLDLQVQPLGFGVYPRTRRESAVSFLVSLTVACRISVSRSNSGRVESTHLSDCGMSIFSMAALDQLDSNLLSSDRGSACTQESLLHFMPQAFPMFMQGSMKPLCYRVCFDLLELGGQLPACGRASARAWQLPPCRTPSRMELALFKLLRGQAQHAASSCSVLVWSRPLKPVDLIVNSSHRPFGGFERPKIRDRLNRDARVRH